ncbi:MAG: transcriptional regulator [Janthinobacterium lividum]
MENTTESPIEQACASVGGQASMAKRLGVAPAVVNQWVKELRPVPIIYCCAIERESGVSRKMLRPNDWHLIWPDLKSRSALPRKSKRSSLIATT